MSARVLVLDAVATNRIIMTSKLSASHYHVTASHKLINPDDVADLPPSRQPDVILLDANLSRWNGLDLCHAFKNHASTAHIPVLMTLPAALGSVTADAFEAGADDVLVRPLNEQVMLARLRNLIRANLRTRVLENSGNGLGQPFVESPAHEASVSRTAFVSTGFERDAALGKTIQEALGRPLEILRWSEILATADTDHSVDLIIVASEAQNTRDPLNLICDLRSRSASRDSAIIMVTSTGMNDPALISEALNSGANDVVSCEVNQVELRARLLRQIVTKRREDALRAHIQSGLRMATTDPLTGLHNRRYATSRLTRIAELTRETGSAFALLMLDVDHFKLINDTYGHSVGDEVLKSIATKLHDNLRDSDLLARIGGEEFLIAMPDACHMIAMSTADRLRRTIETLPLIDPNTGTRLSVTMSIGMTISNGQAANEQLLYEADRALYAAKAGGRNTISLAQVAA